jgi:hypothetical protein
MIKEKNRKFPKKPDFFVMQVAQMRDVRAIVWVVWTFERKTKSAMNSVVFKSFPGT